MLCSIIVGVKRSIVFASIFAILATALTQLPIYAADTQIETAVCSGTSSSASMVIDSPQSDTVIDQLPLGIEGTIRQLTQIDITINGLYDSTIPVSANQTSFTASLQLAEGTHTIVFEGNDVCQFENPVETLVITYHPKATPGEGPTTPTETPSSPTSSGSEAPSGTVNNEPGSLSNIPIIGPIQEIIHNIGTSLDIDATARQDGLTIAMIRFALFALGVGLLFFGSIVVRWFIARQISNEAVRRYIQGSNSLQDPKMGAHVRRNSMIAKGSGGLLLAMAFII